tara:strand:- start:457 stop:999 length:543 start_codon:yes stop_codon:yes gene_type:complete
MKKALLILLLATFSTIVAQDHKINWLSIEEVEVLQQKEPRKVLMDVYTSWCGPCKMMMRNTFTNKDVINYINKNFYAIKFDAESGDDVTFKGTSFKNPSYNPNARRKSPHQFAQALGISSYPTIIYMDEDMNIIAPIKGYQTPSQIELYLKLFGEENYQEIGATKESFKQYAENFKPTFQ